MKKYPVNFEIDYTFKELFLSADIYMFDKDIFTFCKENLCIPLSTSFVASRLSRIEKTFGEQQFMICKLRIDEAYEEYMLHIKSK